MVSVRSHRSQLMNDADLLSVFGSHSQHNIFLQYSQNGRQKSRTKKRTALIFLRKPSYRGPHSFFNETESAQRGSNISFGSHGVYLVQNARDLAEHRSFCIACHLTVNWHCV
ncbi:hypothetical protein RRG08_065619 [Elysia crispata]|uniref:Uncharacterized protein n=1 Tax=Elysia crispata TaxID=231223 RepID=A0AAE0YPI7_9GAST|nr:hypothetical protein RRG08_065619 [Elysia crispata]